VISIGSDNREACQCKLSSASGIDPTQTSTPPAPTPCEAQDGEPVGVNSGYQTDNRVDLTLPAPMVLAVTPYYHSQSEYLGHLGWGWSSILSVRLFNWDDGTWSLRDQFGRREDFNVNGSEKTASFYGGGLSIGADTVSFRASPDQTLLFLRSSGVLARIRDDAGRSITFQYDASNTAGSIAVEGTTLRKYPSRGVSPTAIPEDYRATLAMDFRVTKMLDGTDPSRFLAFEYDTSGAIVRATSTAGATTTYSYDSWGNLLKVVFPDGTLRRYRWSQDGQHRLLYFDAQPIRASQESNDAILTKNTFDGLGRVVSQVFQGGTYSFVRDPYVRSTTETTTERIRHFVRKSTVTRTEPDGLGGTRSTVVVYIDSVRNRQPLAGGAMEWVSRIERIEETIGGIATVRRIGYDQWNNILWQQRPDGTRQDLTRDGQRRVTALLETPGSGRGPARRKEYIYDAAHRILSEKDSVVGGPRATTKTFVRDGLGRIVEERLDGQGGQAAQTVRTWDTQGRLATELRPSEGLRTHWYSALTRSLPDSVTFADGTGERYTRDAAGRITKTRNQVGQFSHAWYDKASRDTLRCGFDSLCTRSRYDGPDLVGTEDGIRLASNGSKSSPMRVRKFEVDGYGRRVKELLQSGSRWILVRKSVVDSWGNEVEAWDNPDSTNTDSTRWRLIERNVYDGLSRRLERRTFPNGRLADSLVERFAYDAIGNLLSTTDSRGQTITRTVDPWGNVLTETDALARTTTRTYDHGNRVLTETDAAGRVVRHVYDAVGNETRRIGASLDTTHWVYQGGLLRKERNPEGSWSTYHYDSRGRLARMVRKVGDSTLAPDANDVVTGYAYDALGNRLRDTVAGVVQHRLAYDAGGRVVRDTNALGPVTQTRYDDLGRVTTVILPSPDTLLTRYDAAGRISMRILRSQGKTPDTLSILRYDDAHRPIWERTPGSGTIQKVYDGTDFLVRTTDSLGRVTTFVQDRAGQDSTVSVAGGAARRTVRDAVGRVSEQWDERGYRIRMVYDNRDRLTSLIDNENNTTAFAWSDTAIGWAKRVTTYPDGKKENHYWDREGRLLRTMDGRGIISRNYYDSLGRVVRIHFRPIAAANVTDSIVLRYDAWDRLIKATQGTSWDSARYDALGRVTNRYQRIDGTTYTLGYAYDMNKRLRDLTLPDGSKVQTFYNARGLVETLQMGSRSVAWFVAKNGLETSRSYSNGTGLNSFYRKDGSISAHTWVPLGKQYPYLEYGYDAFGNRSLIRRKVDSTRSEAMTFTPDHQLNSWKRGRADAAGAISAPTASQSWSNLDSRGNWVAWNDGTGNQTRVHSGANEIQSIQTPTGTSPMAWDGAGNRIADGGNLFTWNVRGLMDTVKIGGSVAGAYGYDALGRRNLKVAGGRRTVFVYDGWQCVWQKVTGSGTDTTKAFVYANYIDEPVNMVRKWGSSTDTLWYMQGNNFNVEALTDRTGAIVERYEYTPYGKVTIFTGAGPDGKWLTADDVVSNTSARGNTLTFQGRELDAETALYYFRARYYSTWLGRFMSRDPIRYSAGQIGLYRYPQNDPISGGDPSGLSGRCSDDGKLYLLGLALVYGIGERNYNFNEASAPCWISQLKGNSAVSRLRSKLISDLSLKCGNSCAAVVRKRESYGYEDEPFDGNWRRVYRFAKDGNKIITLGADLGTFMGGFNVDGLGVADCSIGKANLFYSISDKKGIESLTRPPWMPPGTGLDDRDGSGPLSTIWVNFSWEESGTVSINPKCKCKDGK
jgi:RHS repeat-associated protein